MNPSYKTQLDIYVRAPVEANSVWLRRIGYLPFVPRIGDTLRLTEENNEENQIDVELEEVVWDAAGGQFVCQYVDESVVEAYKEQQPYTIADCIAEYKAFDFVRLTYPTGRVVKCAAETPST